MKKIRSIFSKIFSKNNILVKDIMTKNPLRIDWQESTQKAAKMMSEHRVGTVIVLKNNKPIGILTDTDLTKRIVALCKDPKKIKVSQIMTTPLIFSSPSDKITDVVFKMKKHRIKRIPIIDNRSLVGVLTTTDIARNVPEMMELLEARLLMRENPPTFEESITSGVCEICGNYSDNLVFENDEWACEDCKE
ncbi:MAG: CBS domain-containing protein [Candidatus Aenigmarchaeota archaeon]|nr:CBS domain-containing protein [Candidatus Aenigmarchaeota archaeon]